LRINIEAPRWSEATQMSGVETKRRMVATIAGAGRNERGCRPITALGLTRYIPNRLIEQYRHPGGLAALRLPFQRNLLMRPCLAAKLRHDFAIDPYPAALYVSVCLAARTHAALGHKFRNAYFFFHNL